MKRILIIYDYASVRELLAEELAADGHLVVPIGNPALAREVIGALRPDLLLINLYMSGKNRWDVLQEIKEQNPDLRILVLSHYAVNEPDFPASLADVYVVKSFLLEGLRQRVAEILQRKATNERVKTIENAQPGANSRKRPATELPKALRFDLMQTGDRTRTGIVWNDK